MKRRISACIMASILIILSCISINAKISIPEHTESFYVADFANVLNKDTVNHIVSQNDNLYSQTGAQIVIVTMDFLSGQDIENYAYTMFNEWSIGSKDKNNGVLLLLVIGEEKYWIVQGKGLETTLSSGVLGDILDTYLEPDFNVADYNSGVMKTFNALLDVVEKSYNPELNSKKEEDSEDEEGSFSSMITIIIIVIVLAGFVNGGKMRRKNFYSRRPYISRMGDSNNSSYRSRSGRGNSGFGGSRGSGGSGSSRGSGRGGGGGSTRGGGAGRK